MKRKVLSLILAGAIVASLAGCKSSEPSADGSVSTPDAGSASVSTPNKEPIPVPTPEVKPAPTPTPETEPAPTPTPETEPTPTPTPDVEPEPAPAPDVEPEPAPIPDAEPTPAPDPAENAGPSLDELIQMTEQALSQGGLSYDVSAEGDGIVVSVWMDGLGSTLSFAAASGFSVESALLANGGEALVLLERNLLELAGAAGYEDMPVTLRLLDDRDPDHVLLVISDGEITVFEN